MHERITEYQKWVPVAAGESGHFALPLLFTANEKQSKGQEKSGWITKKVKKISEPKVSKVLKMSEKCKTWLRRRARSSAEGLDGG